MKIYFLCQAYLVLKEFYSAHISYSVPYSIIVIFDTTLNPCSGVQKNILFIFPRILSGLLLLNPFRVLRKGLSKIYSRKSFLITHRIKKKKQIRKSSPSCVSPSEDRGLKIPAFLPVFHCCFGYFIINPCFASFADPCCHDFINHFIQRFCIGLHRCRAGHIANRTVADILF